jgi:hypothetical protein
MNTSIVQQPLQDEILRACRLLMAPGAVHELRIPKAGKERTISGYFDSPEKMAEAVMKLDGKYAGIYMTLNPCKPELLARACNRFTSYAELTTSDPDILQRRWLLIDCDPKRASGISSTDAEHERAITIAEDIRKGLHGDGWPEPIVADSGNGVHLLYLLDVANTQAHALLIQRVLKGVADRYGTDDVSVDLTVYNAARITKVYGILVKKGDNTPKRPHRRSGLLGIPDERGEVTLEMLERVAPKADEKPKLSLVVTAGGFTAAEFIARHGALQVRKEKNHADYVCYELVTCPFNAEHNGGSAAIYQYTDGKLGFSCKHNSCAGKGCER